jgi:signal transduction histidine kinase
VFCGGLVAAVGCVVLVGWHFDIIVLRRLLPGVPQTTPLSAVTLILLGIALILARRAVGNQAARGFTVACTAVATLVIVLMAWAGVHYVLRLDGNIELLLYPELVRDNGGIYPGRPSPQTVIAVILIAGAIGLAPRPSWRTKRWVLGLMLAGLILPWLAMFGYASSTNPFYALTYNPQTGMSPLTAMMCIILSVGVLAIRPGEGLLGVLLAPTAGGHMVRRLLPIVLIIPLFFGWLVTYGRSASFFDTATGFALSWGITSLFFAALVLWQAMTLHKYDMRLKMHADALERSNMDLQQFAYVTSHDLQAPLRSISGFVQLIQQTYQGRLDAEADDWIARTVASAQQMQTMIRDILLWSRIDSRSRPFEPVPLDEVFQEAVIGLASSIRDAGATVTADALPTVPGDRSQLVNLLQNLIGNGLKYQGDAAPVVHVSADRAEGRWSISVRDNGIGIEPQHHERIFEMFRRLHTQKDYPGTGIGLAICRRVVDRHGGAIWVTSVPAEGSAFHFSIPDQETATNDG